MSANVSRRWPGALLIGAAVFLLTLAALVRTQVSPALELLPAELDTTVVLQDAAASYLDTATWEEVGPVPLERRVTIVGQPAPGATHRAAWTMVTVTAAGDHLLDYSDRRVALDRASSAAVNCCGEHVRGDTTVRQTGLVLHWPAGAAGEEYPFYDPDVRAAPVMRMDGTEEIAGVSTRRYVQTIGPEPMPNTEMPVPAEVLGLSGERTVPAERWLEVTRTYWVEPVSGRVVHITEEREETLRPESGQGEAVLLSTELSMPDADTTAAATTARRQALLLRTARDWLPPALAGVGALLLAAGVVRAWWAR